MSDHIFQQFVESEDPDQLNQLQQELINGGYSSVYRFVEQFREQIKTFGDEDMERIQQLIAKGEKFLPDPGAISPSWQDLWPQFRSITEHKIKVLKMIPLSEREGEWQILMDNPYTHQQIVCYPGLTFAEAAYLFGYFRSDLKRNEYIRMQKVQNVIMEFGT